VDITRLTASLIARLTTAIVVAAGVPAMWVSSSPGVVSADDEVVATDSRDPDARLQVIIHTVEVIEDHDVGSGQFGFRIALWRVNSGCPPESSDPACMTILATSAPIEFSANDGETRAINRVLPDPNSGATVHDATISPDGGIPVRNGQHLGLVIHGEEQDYLVDDNIGTIFRFLAPENDWDIGVWTDRGRQKVGCTFIPPGCPFAPGGEIADTIVTYEIRPMPLPDLTIDDIRYLDVAGKQFICPIIVNRGDIPSGTFPLSIRADHKLVKTLDHLGPLSVGGVTDPCIPRTDLPAESHLLSFRLDEEKRAPESQERNNLYEHRIEAISPTIPAPGTGANSGPVVISEAVTSRTGSSLQADLVLKSVRVEVDGSSAGLQCQAGKNDIAVVVKNDGDMAAPGFVVRLRIDDGDEAELTVAPLEAGKELTLAFNDVRLKKGERRLEVAADSKKAVAEPDDLNNERVMIVRCEEDD
jgi:hypothetical protein